jgi:hypothetical protein
MSDLEETSLPVCNARLVSYETRLRTNSLVNGPSARLVSLETRLRTNFMM